MSESSAAAHQAAPATEPADSAALLSDPDRPNKTSPMSIMGRILGERKGLFAGNLFVRLIKDLLPFQGPILIGILVDLLSGTERGLFGIDLTPNDVRSVVIIAGLMGVLAVAKTVIGYIHTIVAAHLGRHVVQAARRDLAEASMQMALDERRRFNSGDLLDRCLADSKGLRGFTQNVIIRVITNTVRAVYPLAVMFMIDPLLAVVVLSVIPLQSTFSAILQRRLQRQTHVARSREASHTSAVKEAIDGWNNVASVGGQDWAAEGLNATASASEDAKIIKKHTTASISAVIRLCTALGIAAVYAIGGWRIIESGALDGSGDVAAGALTLGSLTTFVGVAKKTYAPFQAYTKIVSSYRTGLVNLERIADVLDAPMIDPREDGPRLAVGAGDITLDNVSFSYDAGSSPTLSQLSGSIPGRSLTVITGSSGAGKTTLLRLLLGLDVPSTGTISIDDQDINVANLASLKQAMALVPQEPMLFSGTMADNLLLGLEDTTTKELVDACDRAGLLDTVRALPNGLETKVGSGKHMLSGGQLRRMAIARALLRRPNILLLDEPTTGLDEENSTLVLNTLRRISDETTVVMVSHRSEPLRASDHHLVLKDGGWSANANHVARAATDATTEPAATWRADPPSEPAKVQPPSSNGASNGIAAQPTTPQPTRQHAIAMSAMGRPINLTEFDTPQAATRLMLVSGHRPQLRPVAGIAAAVVAQIENDTVRRSALASIDDINPDGTDAPGRTTVLGVNIETDHAHRRAAETRALHDALAHWQADVLIDVAAIAEPVAISPDGADIEVAVRFVPNAEGAVPPALIELAQAIRALLDTSDYRYQVRLKQCVPGSITDALRLPVIELTALHHDAARTMPAIIVATSLAGRAVTQTVPA